MAYPGYYVPNQGDGGLASADQATLFSSDLDILSAGFDRIGVVSGCAVSAGTGLTVDIASGEVVIRGRRVTITTKSSVALTAADGTNPRIDLVEVTNADAANVVTGTPGANPVAPEATDGNVVLAQVYVLAGDTDITGPEITDRRVIMSVIPADEEVRYVSKNGADTNDGLSWGSAFLTIKAAIADLPSYGSGGNARQAGTIYVGPGLFTEDNPLEFNSDLRIIGHSPQISTAGGTEVRGSNQAHLFAPTGTFTGWANNVLMKDIRLEGTGITGSYDLLRISQGGYNCRIENVLFRTAPRHGIYFIDNAINAVVINCQWVHNVGDCIYFYLDGAIPLLQIIHSQIDEITGYFLNIEHITNAAAATIVVDGLKSETATAGDLDRVINFKPRTSSGGNPPTIMVSNVGVAQNDAGGGTAICYEESGAGVGANWHLQNIWNAGQDYTSVFNSQKTSQTIGNYRHVLSAQMHQFVSINDGPLHVVGGHETDVGDGSPESTLTRGVGARYIQSDGDEDGVLWVKVSGTGNTGWQAAMTNPIPTHTDATRGAAGTAGRVIFNTGDGQLNIDDGTNWTLPDGTTT